MTAYGYAANTEEDKEISIALSGLNRKTLDIILDLPKPLEGLEREVLLYLKARLKRGKVHLRAQLQELKPQAEATLSDLIQLQGLLDRLKTFAEGNHIPYQPTLDTLARLLACLPSSVSIKSSFGPCQTYEKSFFAALEDAFAAFEDSRIQEGLALKKDIQLHLLALEKASQEVKALCPATLVQYRTSLLERLKQAGLELNLQDERVLKELALFADKSDITEELTRLDSHYQQFHSALEDSLSGSRKIEFLCQEIQREWNTVGSKANSLSITQHMLEAKLNLEKIKEQVQNLE